MLYGYVLACCLYLILRFLFFIIYLKRFFGFLVNMRWHIFASENSDDAYHENYH